MHFIRRTVKAFLRCPSQRLQSFKEETVRIPSLARFLPLSDQAVGCRGSSS